MGSTTCKPHVKNVYLQDVLQGSVVISIHSACCMYYIACRCANTTCICMYMYIIIHIRYSGLPSFRCVPVRPVSLQWEGEDYPTFTTFMRITIILTYVKHAQFVVHLYSVHCTCRLLTFWFLDGQRAGDLSHSSHPLLNCLCIRGQGVESLNSISFREGEGALG